jgi:hypothetical protein
MDLDNCQSGTTVMDIDPDEWIDVPWWTGSVDGDGNTIMALTSDPRPVQFILRASGLLLADQTLKEDFSNTFKPGVFPGVASPTATEDPNLDPDSWGLYANPIGVAVGVTVAMVVFLSLSICFVIRYRRIHRARHGNPPARVQNGVDGKPELDASPMAASGSPNAQELATHEIARIIEIDATGPSAKAISKPPVELPASSPGDSLSPQSADALSNGALWTVPATTFDVPQVPNQANLADENTALVVVADNFSRNRLNDQKPHDAPSGC